MIDAKIRVFRLEYGLGEIEIDFKFGTKLWTIKNDIYFTSPKAAENQAKKLAKKLGFNIIDMKIG